MSEWFKWDDPTPEERERDRLLDEIGAAERRALDACRQITTITEKYPELVQSAGSSALMHIATVAQAGGQALFRRTVDRDELKRQEWVR